MATTPSTRRLPPSRALALLKRHCSVLRGLLALDASRKHTAHASHLWLGLIYTNVTVSDLEAGFGYQLRVAVDIVNALCACQGFAPHRDPSFWRHAMSTLWIAYSSDARTYQRVAIEGPYLVQPPQREMKAFDAAAFSCFAVDLRTVLASGSELVLAELWHPMTWTDAAGTCPHRLLKSRDSALTQLRHHAVRPVRMLQLKLLVPANSESWRTPYADLGILYDWQPLTNALAKVDANVEQANAQTLTLAIHQTRFRRFVVHTSNVLGLSRLLTTFAFIHCLHLDVALSDDTVNAQDCDVGFCQLLYTLLVERKSLRSLRLMHENGQFRAIAMACSLLPTVSCLREFGCNIAYNPVEYSWRWLVYALQHPLRLRQDHGCVEPHALVVGGIQQSRSAGLKAARASATPLREIAFDTIEATAAATGRTMTKESCQSFASGTMVARAVAPTTERYTCPVFRKSLPRAVIRDEEMEVVVVVASMSAVGVVARGYGLCWLREDSVSLAAGLDLVQPRHKKGHPRNPIGIRDLHVDCQYWGIVMPTLRSLDCGVLTSLTLTNCCCDHDVFGSLLLHCPSLLGLQLDFCSLSSLEPLVDAYASPVQPCRIASLLLRIFHADRPLHEAELGVTPLWEMLEDSTHPGTHTLRHLSLSLDVGNEHLLGGLARILAVNRTLETVFMNPGERFWDAQQRNVLASRLLSPF